MRKFVRIAFLLVFVLLVAAVVVAQTDYAHEKLARWIEKKTHGELKIGRIEGILPFWARLHEVDYHTDTLDVRVDEAEITFLPFTLLYGRIHLPDVQIGDAKVKSTGKGWPSFPMPIDVQSFSIQSLAYNDLKDLKVSGMAELQDNFFAKLSISQPQVPGELAVTIVGNPSEQTVHTIVHYQPGKSNDVWIEGNYRWGPQDFVGTWYGHKEGLKLNGVIEGDLKTRKLTATGVWLDRPFTFIADLTPPAKPIFLTYGDHQWQVTGHFDWLTGLFHFHLHGREVVWKKAFVPEIVMNGTYQTGSNPLLNFRLDLPDLILLDPAFEVFPQVGVCVNGYATHQGLTASGIIEGLGDHPFSLSLELPLHVHSFSAIDIDEEAPFFMQIRGCGSIDPILTFLENASLVARGRIDLDLQARGTWKTPEITGHFVYTDGRVESFSTGALFQGIHLEMEGMGNALQIRSFTARDKDQGEMTGGGYILWDPDHYFPFLLNLYANRYQILGVDPLTLTVNAEVTLEGSTQGVMVSGYANLVEGHLTIASGLPPQVPTVEVTYINPIYAPKPEEEIPRKIIPVFWDLMIHADRHLYIAGKGLDSEWGGRLHITGEQKDFQFDGKLRLAQGRFDIINQTFDLVHGRIQIAGLEPGAIFVDLKGDYELPHLTASIVVTGSLDHTQFSFCSNPPMNTNQILSWILFQEDINELTPMQACRLASILVSLSGKYTGPKTFDKIKDKLGIDVFSITDCDIDSADLTFQVGKYLSQGTFVGINKSISGNFDSVMIQTRLFRNFYLEADYGGSLNGLTPNGGKGILKWYKTY